MSVGLNERTDDIPLPPLASNEIGGFGLLQRLRKNAFTAFPPRCFVEPVIRMSLPGRDLILVNTPDAIGEVLSANPANYRRVPAIRRVLGPIVGRGLVASEGEPWRRQRRLLAPAFTPRSVSLLGRHFDAGARQACEALSRLSREPIDLLAFVQQLSLEIAAASMFSLEAKTFGAELRGLVTYYSQSIGRPRATDFLFPPGLPAPVDISRGIFRRKWRRLIRNIVAQRRSQSSDSEPRDLFDLLAAAYGEADDELLIDEVATMIVAGHETTALAIFWSLYLLARFPQWQEMLKTEFAADGTIPSDSGDALMRLRRTRAVVEEALRLYPPAFMLARQAATTHDLFGIAIKAGALVFVPICMLHRNPNIWQAPERFDPHRFLDSQKPPRNSYLPFGAGPNVCIGSQLALTEAVLVIAHLVRRFEVRLCGAEQVLPVAQITTRPDRSPMFELRAR